MPQCKNDPKRTYKGSEPSPKGLGHCAHSEKIGKKMKGKDGNQWIITETKKGVKRWLKVKKSINFKTDSKKKLDINNKILLNKILSKKSITIQEEELIKNILCNSIKFKKIYDEKFIKKLYSLKKRKKNISIDKSITLYDEFLYEDKVKCKLNKGNYVVYTTDFIKFKNILTTSMIVIEKDEKINMNNIKINKTKHSINIGDSQKIVFEENNNLLYKYELKGMQFFGYNLPIYYGKINNELKLILIPISNIYNL